VLDRGVKHAPDPREILACVVAFGTNMGLGKMAEVSGMGHPALITTARSYLRLGVRAAEGFRIFNSAANPEPRRIF
jgi:hypothetical protein